MKPKLVMYCLILICKYKCYRICKLYCDTPTQTQHTHKHTPHTPAPKHTPTSTHTHPHPHTQTHSFIILAQSNMFQLEDSHEASIKNFLQIRKIQIPNTANAPESSQFCMAHIVIVPITLLLEISLTLIF